MVEMDYRDKEVLREVLVSSYSRQANTWDMNDAVLRVACCTENGG